MVSAIKNPDPEFKEVIHTHFKSKRKHILKQIKDWEHRADDKLIASNSNQWLPLTFGKKIGTSSPTMSPFKQLANELTNLLQDL